VVESLDCICLMPSSSRAEAGLRWAGHAARSRCQRPACWHSGRRAQAKETGINRHIFKCCVLYGTRVLGREKWHVECA
jgi:hypothetical protein